MTNEQFWKLLESTLKLPFDVKDVTGVEFDLMDGVYIDLKDGSTYGLSFSETESLDD